MSGPNECAVVAEELPTEAKVITKAFLDDVLRTSEGRSDLVVDKFEITTSTKPGDSYLSRLLSVCVFAHDREGAKREYHLVTKNAFVGDTNLSAFCRQLRYFYKEEKAYTRLFPSMEAANREGLGDLKLSIPRFYMSLMNSSHEVLVMEDLSRAGYTLTHPRNGLNFAQCKLAIKELAKFHALGYAFKGGNADRLKENFDFLFFENYLCREFMDVYEIIGKIALKSVVQLVKANIADVSVIQKVEKLPDINYLETMTGFLMQDSPFATICHGDATCRNMLFRQDSSGTPVDVKFIDFQIVRYAVPTTDLAYFIYQSTDGNLRRMHLAELLRLYHAQLVKYLDMLHVPMPSLTPRVFNELYEKTKVFGILFAVVSGALTLANPEDTPDFMKDPNSPDILRQVSDSLEKSGRKMRILDLVNEAIDADFL